MVNMGMRNKNDFIKQVKICVILKNNVWALFCDIGPFP